MPKSERRETLKAPAGRKKVLLTPSLPVKEARGREALQEGSRQEEIRRKSKPRSTSTSLSTK